MDFKVQPEGLRLSADRAAGPQEDIYRGEPPSPSRSRPPSVATASSSSSGWSGLGLRRGALGAVLELAINRWARASSGSSTSSSSSSIHTHLPRQRRRRPSNATSTLHSESIIRARRKARDECRVLQREFTLFLPASLIPPVLTTKPLQKPVDLSQSDRILKSSSLPLVLTQLDSAFKRSAKLRRLKQLQNASPAKVLEPWFNNYVQSGTSLTASQVDTLRDDKGKAREEPRISETSKRQTRADAEQLQQQQAWWLDVSSPTWSDMCEIAKILHLHPLTLEDILHQDPREKLELFPRLGYYFIVFRALESQHAQSSARTQTEGMTINGSASFDGNIVLGTNVYVVVFRDGICSFHFEDIADHVDRVRSKMMHLEETFHMSSDWIAHGILDSIVDEFFPMLNSIEQEIKFLDDLLLSDGQPIHQALEQSPQNSSSSNRESLEKTTDETVFDGKEKMKSDSSSFHRTLRKTPDGHAASWFSLHLRRFGAVLPDAVLRRWVRFSSPSAQAPPLSPLMRMASTRRLVTSLTRLLGTKSEVVSQIRKRLTNGGSMGPKLGSFEHTLSAEVGIYFGDIQDHILTLQHSLAHYERMLSHSHPAYISHLRVSLSQAKGGMDMALLTLSVISVSVVAMQLVTGMFSTNLGRIPSNRRPMEGPPRPPAPFNVFGAVLAVAILIGFGTIFLSRYWWLHAKRKYARRRRSNF